MNTGYKATIYVESSGIGHAFIKLEAPGQPPITVGYYPVAHLPAAPGMVSDDSQIRSTTDRNAPPIEHPSDWNKSFDLDIGLSEISVERLFTGVPYLSYALAVRNFADNSEQVMGTILLSSLRVANEDYMRSAA